MTQPSFEFQTSSAIDLFLVCSVRKVKPMLCGRFLMAADKISSKCGWRFVRIWHILPSGWGGRVSEWQSQAEKLEFLTRNFALPWAWFCVAQSSLELTVRILYCRSYVCVAVLTGWKVVWATCKWFSKINKPSHFFHSTALSPTRAFFSVAHRLWSHFSSIRELVQTSSVLRDRSFQVFRTGVCPGRSTWPSFAIWHQREFSPFPTLMLRQPALQRGFQTKMLTFFFK